MKAQVRTVTLIIACLFIFVASCFASQHKSTKKHVVKEVKIDKIPLTDRQLAETESYDVKTLSDMRINMQDKKNSIQLSSVAQDEVCNFVLIPDRIDNDAGTITLRSHVKEYFCQNRVTLKYGHWKAQKSIVDDLAVQKDADGKNYRILGGTKINITIIARTDSK